MKIRYGKTMFDLWVNQRLIHFDIHHDIDNSQARDAFNVLITQLSLQYSDKLNYWLLKISERNPLTSDLFLEICYIIFVEKELAQQSQHILIVTNKPTLYAYFRARGFKSSLYSRCIFILCKQQLKLIRWAKCANFLLIWTYRYFLTKIMKKNAAPPQQNLEGSCILQTWATSANFKNDQFHEGYYGDLAQYLKNHQQVFTWPILFRGTNLKRAILTLRKNPTAFILMEDFLYYRDYLKTIWQFLSKANFRFKPMQIFYDNQKIPHLEQLLHMHLLYESVEIGTLFYYLCYRLHKAGIQKITFIQHFENLIPEKGLILGVKKWLPHAKVIGYFHTSKPRNLLNLEYASVQELGIAPKPGCIIFNSNFYLNYYQQKFPSLNLKNGFAFKQAYLSQVQVTKGDPNCLLILFSGNRPDIDLMLQFLHDHISLLKPYHLLIKMHPMYLFKIDKLVGLRYDICSEALPQLLPKVNKVIATYSAALLETSIAGKHIGFIYDKKRLLLNPFDDLNMDSYHFIGHSKAFEQFLVSIHTPIEISQPLFNTNKNDYSSFLEELS